MSNAPTTIGNATEGTCLFCGAEDRVFEVTTSCGRLSAVPLCSNDLFALVVAQNRNGAVRGTSKNRSKPAAPKNRSMTASDNGNQPGSDGGSRPEFVAEGSLAWAEQTSQ